MRSASILLGIATLIPSTAGAQPAPEAYSFYTIQEGDTLAVEQVIRTDEQVNVDMLVQQQGVRFMFTLELGPEATVRRVTNRVFRRPQDEEPTQVVTASFRGDSVDVEISGDRSMTRTVATLPGALPWIRPSHALLEQALLRSRSMSGSVDSIPFFNIANGQTTTATVVWEGQDTATLRFAEATISAEVGDDGFLNGLLFRGEGIRAIRKNAFGRLPIEEVDYGPPDGAPYRAEEVTVRTPAGLSLSGTLTLPDPATGKAPGIVTITGSGRQDRDEQMVDDAYRPFRQIADTLARRGIATLRLDDRGVNDSDPGPPGATSADFADDIRAALAYLRARDDIDDGRLGLVGHSEGGVIAPMVAATDTALAAVVLLAGPAYTLRRVHEYQVRRMIEGMETLTAEEREMEYRRAELARDERARQDPWFRAALSYDPLPTARQVRAPVLLLQGKSDQQISPEQADTLARALRQGGNDDVTVVKFADINHLFLADPDGQARQYDELPSFEVPPEVLGVIADWLVDRLERADG